jgi:hypothetical protein
MYWGGESPLSKGAEGDLLNFDDLPLDLLSDI